MAQAYRNVGTALAAVDASFADVAKITAYVVDWRPEKMGDLIDGVGRVAEELALVPAPITLIGVAALGEPDLLVEIEATAVLA